MAVDSLGDELRAWCAAGWVPDACVRGFAIEQGSDGPRVRLWQRMPDAQSRAMTVCVADTRAACAQFDAALRAALEEARSAAVQASLASLLR
jgi:hypothetical protein